LPAVHLEAEVGGKVTSEGIPLSAYRSRG
jgi:hypothetical protein